ncbi:MAG: PD40 domain-containing protein [Candidatus Sericytochromatia bacterium]|nr:PD40 domain-containing protein [Candidatus Sericytochromatia bacterium]
MSRTLIFSLLSLSLFTACALPSAIPFSGEAPSSVPTGQRVPNPTKLPSAIPSDQADNRPFKPITGPGDIPVLSSFGGKIAYFSNRDQSPNHEGTGSLENENAIPESQVASPYLYENGISRRLGSYTVQSAENLSMGFASNGKQLGYLIPEGNPYNLVLYMQNLDFTQLNREGLPIGRKYDQTLPVYKQLLSMHVPRWGISSKNILAVIKQDRSGKSDIWVGKPGSSDLIQVTQTERYNESSFQEIEEVIWSPDGSQIYFTMNLIGALPQGTLPYKHLVRIDRTGANQSVYPVPFPVRHIQVSPDGNKLLFTGTDPTQNPIRDHLYTINKDGTGLTTLTQGRLGEHYWGKWSPDGSQIVYVNNTKDFQSLCTAPSAMFPPSSPEERRAAEDYMNCRMAGEELVMAKADGSQFQQLTRNEAQDTYPTWSPDGKYLAFTSKRDGNREIYVIKKDGSTPLNISQNPSEDSRPVWGP